MKSLTTLLFLLMAIGSITAQTGSASPYKFLEGIEYYSVREIQYVDSVTIFSVLQVKEGGSVKMKMYKTDADWTSEKFNTVLLNMNHNEVYKSLNSSYERIDGKIVRFRKDKIKSEIHFFKDDFDGEKFTNSATPFYKQIKNEDSKKLKRIEIYKNSIVIEFYNTRKNKNSTVSLLDEMEFLFFDVKNLNQLGSTSLKIPLGAEIPLSRLTELTMDDNIFTLMPFYDPEVKKKYIKIVYIENFEFKNINVENNKTSNQTDAVTLIKVENKYLLYFINKNEVEWSSSLCNLNLQNQTYELLDENIISDEQIFRENKNDKKRYFMYRFESTPYFKDGAFYVISLGNFDSNENGTRIEDILITKIENGEIKWNQFVKSTMMSINSHYEYFSVSFDEENMIINDIEPEGAISENGEYIGKNLVLLNYQKISILVNRQNGEFKRIIGEKI